MKADVTTENSPACPPEKDTRHDRGELGCGKYTHEDQRGSQAFVVLLCKVAVVLVGFSLELVVELNARATGHSKEVGKERWQCFKHCIFQTRNEKRGRQRVEDEGKGSVDARFWVDGSFPHDVLQGAMEGFWGEDRVQ